MHVAFTVLPYRPPATLCLGKLITNNNNIVLETFLSGIHFSVRANLFSIWCCCVLLLSHADSTISILSPFSVFHRKKIFFAQCCVAMYRQHYLFYVQPCIGIRVCWNKNCIPMLFPYAAPLLKELWFFFWVFFARKMIFSTLSNVLQHIHTRKKTRMQTFPMASTAVATTSTLPFSKQLNEWK